MGGRNKMKPAHDGGVVPLVVIAVCLVVGGYGVWERPFDVGVPYVWEGVLLVSAVGFLYVGWRLAAGRSSTADSAPPKTPPAPEPLKEEIVDERADGYCEFCRTEAESLAVHHVVPRSEGGPNVRRNLIALCPTCLKKAADDVYARSELREKVRHLEDDQKRRL